MRVNVRTPGSCDRIMAVHISIHTETADDSGFPSMTILPSAVPPPAGNKSTPSARDTVVIMSRMILMNVAYNRRSRCN